MTCLHPKESGKCTQLSEKFVLFSLSQQFGIQQQCHYISIGSPCPGTQMFSWTEEWLQNNLAYLHKTSCLDFFFPPSPVFWSRSPNDHVGKRGLKSEFLNLAWLMGLWAENVFVVLQGDPNTHCKTGPSYRCIPRFSKFSVLVQI